MQKWIVIMMSLAIGVMVTILIAWVLPRFGPMRIVSIAPPANMVTLKRDDPRVGILASDMTMTSFGLQQFRGWGYDREVIYATDTKGNFGIVRGWCGWPMRAMYGSDTTGVGLEHAIAVEDVPLIRPQRPYVGLHFLPTGVLWLGFVVDTLLYAIVAWLLLLVPGRVRRMLRSRRGQCPVCAYPVGGSTVCTECGSKISA